MFNHRSAILPFLLLLVVLTPAMGRTAENHESARTHMLFVIGDDAEHKAALKALAGRDAIRMEFISPGNRFTFSGEFTQGQLLAMERLGARFEPVEEIFPMVAPYRSNQPWVRERGREDITPHAPPVCGDGICNGPENASTCPQDCGGGPAPRTCAPQDQEEYQTLQTNGTVPLTAGAGVRLFVLDTGTTVSHPDLDVQVCLNTSSPSTKTNCTDSNGHGTHTSGSAAATGGIDGLGLIGAAPGATFGFIKICGQKCFTDGLIRGIEEATVQNADVISLSFGASNTTTLRNAVQDSVNNGALFLASSGNSGPTENSIGYPAAYDEVVAVGILGADRIVSRMSSRGADDGNDAVISDEEVELIGGGFVVESTWLDGCYQVLSGTSMSTPSIAGFAAANWQGDAASTRSWLVSVADDIDNSALVPSFDPSTPGWDRVSGHGMSRTAAGTDGSGGAGVVVSPNIVAPDESVSIDVLGPPDSAYRVGINSPDGSWTFGEFTTDAAGVSLLGLTPWTDVGAWLITVDFGGGTTTFLPAFDTFEQASSVDPPPPDPGLITSFELENPGEVPDPAIATISGNVTVEAGSGYTGPQLLGGIPAPDGSQFAYLTNGPGSNGGGDSGSDRTGALGNEFDIAELTVSFTADDPTNVEFQYDVLSSEITDGESPTPDPAPDPFEIRLDGVTIASGAVGQANGSFPAVNGFNLTNITGSDGSFFSDGRLGFATLSTPVAAGPHTLEFFVGDDDGDPAVDTAMLVDEIRLVPEPSTTALLVAGMIFLISASGRRNP